MAGQFDFGNEGIEHPTGRIQKRQFGIDGARAPPPDPMRMGKTAWRLTAISEGAERRIHHLVQTPSRAQKALWQKK
jgi:hypothetical protein